MIKTMTAESHYQYSDALTLYDELSVSRESIINDMRAYCAENEKAQGDLWQQRIKACKHDANYEKASAALAQSARFHIHIDVDQMSDELETLMDKRGYLTSDFLSHQGQQSSPKFIRTLKFNNTKKYKEELKEITDACKADQSFVGFVEGEVIVNRRASEEKEYDASVPIPFRIKAYREPGGRTKTADMHVGLCPIKSSPELMAQLLTMGFSLVLAPKSSGVLAIFSLQGEAKTIEQLFELTNNYIERAGGASKCTMKDERISWLWVSGDSAPSTRMIANIQFNNQDT